MLRWFKKQLGTKAKKQHRRNPGKTLTAYLIFGAICLTFVFFGIEKPSGIDAAGAAAEVNNAIISIAEFRREARQLEKYYSGMFGDKMDFVRQRIPSQALESLIQRELTFQAGTDAGIWGTNEEVRQSIVNDRPEFQEDGRFRKDLYYQLLEANQMTPTEFEGQLRKHYLDLRLRRFFQIVLKPSKMEVEREFLARQQKVNVEFLALSDSDFVPKGSVKDKEIENFLAGRKDQVESYYTENKAKYSTPEQVKARHILIKFKKGDSKSEEAAFKKIEDLAKTLNTNNFEEMAKKHSEDAGSKVKGGDLGYFSRGKMVPQFEATAFNNKIGTISKPVKTTYGYHIIEVMDKKAESVTDLKEVQKEIAKKLLIKEKVAQTTVKLSEELKKGSVKAVRKLAKKWKVKWKETGLFGLSQDSIPKIGKSDDLIEAAFRLSKEAPLLDHLIKHSGKSYVLYYKAGQVPKVEDAKEQAKLHSVEQELETSAGNEGFGEWLDSVSKQAKVIRNSRVLTR